MKFLISLLSVAILSLMLQFFLPWWSLAIAAFFVGLSANQSAGLSWLFGFLGVALVWWGYGFLIDFGTGSILSVKIAQLLPFAFGSPLLLLLVSGIISGLVGAFAALSGSLLRKASGK